MSSDTPTLSKAARRLPGSATSTTRVVGARVRPPVLSVIGTRWLVCAASPATATVTGTLARPCAGTVNRPDEGVTVRPGGAAALQVTVAA